MSKHSNRHAGFGAVGIVLIVAVVLGIAGAGFVVVKHSKNSSGSSTAATTPTPTPTSSKSPTPQPADQPVTPQVTQNTLVIKEWGVQMTLDSTTAISVGGIVNNSNCSGRRPSAGSWSETSRCLIREYLSVGWCPLCRKWRESRPRHWNRLLVFWLQLGRKAMPRWRWLLYPSVANEHLLCTR